MQRVASLVFAALLMVPAVAQEAKEKARFQREVRREIQELEKHEAKLKLQKAIEFGRLELPSVTLADGTACVEIAMPSPGIRYLEFRPAP